MWHCYAIVTDAAWVPDGMFEEPMMFGGGVRVERVPMWVQSDTTLDYESWATKSAVKDARWSFVADYEAQALGSPDPDWQGKTQRSIQSVIDERIALAQVCIWLSRAFPFSAGPLFHFDGEGPGLAPRMSGSLEHIRITNDERLVMPARDDFDTASRLHRLVLALARDGNVWLAIRVLSMALREPLWEVRYMLHWVLLEALFGPSEPREITFRISQRIALFLRGDSEGGRSCFRQVQECYNVRSQAVHGARLSRLTTVRSDLLMSQTETFIREGFRKILEGPGLVEVFNGKGRDPYLDELVFKGP